MIFARLLGLVLINAIITPVNLSWLIFQTENKVLATSVIIKYYKIYLTANTWYLACIAHDTMYKNGSQPVR